jgi:hypothetical protein
MGWPAGPDEMAKMASCPASLANPSPLIHSPPRSPSPPTRRRRPHERERESEERRRKQPQRRRATAPVSPSRRSPVRLQPARGPVERRLPAPRATLPRACRRPCNADGEPHQIRRGGRLPMATGARGDAATSRCSGGPGAAASVSWWLWRRRTTATSTTPVR